LKHSFYVRIEIAPDEPDDGVWPTREETHAKLIKALEHSTARDALSDALMADVGFECFTEGPAREAAVKAMQELFTHDVDVQVDEDAVFSVCPDENYDWVQLWRAVYREE
jgi:hypothetical protein